MSEKLSNHTSPFPLDFMEDFSIRPELTEAEITNATKAFDDLITEVRAKFGKTNEHHPVLDAGPCIWLTREIGNEVWECVIADYSDLDSRNGNHPWIRLDHSVAGQRDLDYRYNRTPDGVIRDLVMDRVSPVSQYSVEQRLLRTICGYEDEEQYGFPAEQTNGHTSSNEVDALKVFLLDADQEQVN